MKRTGFKRKIHKGDRNQTPTPQLWGKRRSARSRLSGGKRTKEWEQVRAILKIEYEAMGIVSCELNYEGCKRDAWLSFAHGLKRRHLQGDQLKTLTILACTPCHDVIERLPEAEMCAIVEQVIRERRLAA